MVPGLAVLAGHGGLVQAHVLGADPTTIVPKEPLTVQGSILHLTTISPHLFPSYIKVIFPMSLLYIKSN
jgi:hypothetical protein